MKLANTVKELTNSYPNISFMSGDTFYYSPAQKTVYYSSDESGKDAVWALLHETGHALREHENYYSDVQLLLFEADAWEEACIVGAKLKIEIDEDYIQDNLDSYRDWIHKRSLCPSCDLSSIQVNNDTYSCVFCHKKWKVSEDRFCRPYRKALI